MFHWKWGLDLSLARQLLAKKLKHFGRIKRLSKLISHLCL
jgi:hypothetical protein